MSQRRTTLDPGAEPLGRVVAGCGNDGRSGCEGAVPTGTYHGPDARASAVWRF